MDPSSATTSDDAATMRELLNRPQLEAVTHGPGPLLVLAGAGSGKTRVITYRIAHLVATHGVPPYRILAVTFTNKAAKEMRERIDRLVGTGIAADLWVGTFHATCARMLRRYHDAVGLARDFVIYDDSDQKALMGRVVKALNVDERRYPPKLLLAAIHERKQHGTAPEEIPVASSADEVLVQVYTVYQRQLLSANAVDFDDLIIHITRIAEDSASVAGSELRRRFDFLLVDEFQDVNPIQYRFVRALSGANCNVCVVGDDDQSIYRWRGADVRIIRGFKHDYSGTKVIRLEQNYRSTANIVRVALGVIKPSREREPKELFTLNAPGTPVRVVAARDEKDEASFAAGLVRESVEGGLDAGKIALLYRIHAQSRVLEEAMRAANIPYQIIGGTRFFDRTEIKDLLAYLRVILNPRSDVDLLRIINVPARQIGQATIDGLVRSANETGRSIYEVMVGDLRVTGLKLGARKRVAAFATLMERLRAAAPELSPREVAERVLDATGYASALAADDTAESDARLENLQELLGSLSEYEDEAVAAGRDPSLSGYLEQVSLVNEVDQLQDVARVSLMTIHAAKGLEFELVLVTGVENELLPYRSRTASYEPGQEEEERRLAYVAFTRARQHLVMVHAASRMIFGNTRYALPSPFINDLPQDCLAHELSPVMQRLRGHLQGISPKTDRGNHAPGERYVEFDDARDVDEELPIACGTLVVHQRYGQGRVESIRPGTPPTALVFFPGWGERNIVMKFLRPV